MINVSASIKLSDLRQVQDKIFFSWEAYLTYDDKEKNILAKKLSKCGSFITKLCLPKESLQV